MRLVFCSAIVAIVAGACGGNSGQSGEYFNQQTEPVDAIGLYLNGFHVSKADPAMQMEAHHYCTQISDDLSQCVLFDGTTPQSKMVGIEYILSENGYGSLPEQERAYWHPHNYEILSGQLRLPGVDAAAETEALRGKMNSYGKTWLTWNTGIHGVEADALPLGPARLQWSLNRDGQDAPGLIAGRDERLELDTAQARQARADLVALARPQGGVNALGRRLPEGEPIDGVTDNGDAATRSIPTVVLRRGVPQRGVQRADPAPENPDASAAPDTAATPDARPRSQRRQRQANP